jgi:hypothetical protein
LLLYNLNHYRVLSKGVIGGIKIMKTEKLRKSAKIQPLDLTAKSGREENIKCPLNFIFLVT